MAIDITKSQGKEKKSSVAADGETDSGGTEKEEQYKWDSALHRKQQYPLCHMIQA
jgi:hypothetical protein